METRHWNTKPPNCWDISDKAHEAICQSRVAEVGNLSGSAKKLQSFRKARISKFSYFHFHMEGGRGGLATGWRNLAVTRSQFKMICVLSQRWAHCTHFPQLQRCFFPGKTKHCNHQGVSDSAYVLSSREESQVLQFREKSSDSVFSPGETVHSQQQNLPGQPLQWAGKYLNIILFLYNCKSATVPWSHSLIWS